MGFYTTCFVEAKDKKEAEDKAVEIVRKDRCWKKGLLNAEKDSPIIYSPVHKICNIC